MPRLNIYESAPELVLGERLNDRVPRADQHRQRTEAEEILDRLRGQPGVILADEVGMGKTFVALAVACSVAIRSRRGPVIVMVPPNLVGKWQQDLDAFCDLYFDGRTPLYRRSAEQKGLGRRDLRYGVAHHSVELLKLLDDPPRTRCHLIFLAQGAMGRRQSDKWVRLAMIREALRRHGRGKARELIQVKKQIHRFVAELIRAQGEQRASEDGETIWKRLLASPPEQWKGLYNATLDGDTYWLDDDPVPEAVVKALPGVDMSPLAEALKDMPVRARGGKSRVSDRIAVVKVVLKEIEQTLWTQLLAQMRWRSPLLVLDEAHHLKNPGTSLARRFQSVESETDLRTGDGAMARVFDRMVFLTATPFQLGHQELVRVLQRFGDIRWDSELGSRSEFDEQIDALGHALTESQRSSINLQRCWSRLGPDDKPADGEDVDAWWQRLNEMAPDDLTTRQRAVIDMFNHARKWREEAQKRLQPWIIRHNKGEIWSGTDIARRAPIEGAAIRGTAANGGLEIPPEQMLPFFLAARSAISPGQDLLGEALCSSYEAFRYTRENRTVEKDDQEDAAPLDLSHAAWYLSEFDHALQRCSGSVHPKLAATVQKTVDLWQKGEKVVVFAFYRQTCRALRIHISREIERRLEAYAGRRLADAGRPHTAEEVDRVVESIQNRFFDRRESPGRRTIDAALQAVVGRRRDDLRSAGIDEDQQEVLLDVMRRFLRVQTTLVHCFPIEEHDTLAPEAAVTRMLDTSDATGLSWRGKFENFIDFLVDRCSPGERADYLEAASRMQTGKIRVEADELTEEDQDEGAEAVRALANVQVAMGTTRRDMRSRLMRAFNTPFFPDILVCSQVMGEGVDLHRYCRHVIHHDLAWNPSSIEQRTGRIDRLGCKAEGRHPINVYLPYLAGTADERQYKVMTDRQAWFRVVMGQEEVANLIPTDADTPLLPPPKALTDSLAFTLSIEQEASGHPDK